MTQQTGHPAPLVDTTPLAIIGLGCLFPGADNSTGYWTAIREGIDAISDIPASHWRVQEYFHQDPKSPDMTYGRRGGFLADVPFNPMEYNIPPATLEAIDSSQLLGLVAAGQALKDAGYGADRAYDRDRVSVILGVTGTLELVIPLGARLGHPRWRAALKEAGVDDATAEDVVQRIADSYVAWQENSFPGLLGNVVAGRISKQFDLGGTNCVVDAACASSLSALHLAAMELATGKSDMVVTGGIDTFNDIFMYMCFSKTPALSPTGDAKPFDASGDGTILGEGLGIVVVKRLADAERAGDRIYAVIRGVGSSSDGKGEAIYTPSAAGQKKAVADAYRRSGVTPDSIGLLEAHGTGTKVGDAVEVAALREIYGEADRPWCALGSVKSQIGHTKAAAGAAGLIKAALALHHKVIPPTIKVKQPLREVAEGRTPFYLTTSKRPWLAKSGQPRRAAVSALGFGGSNFHVVLEEYAPAPAAVDWDGTVQLLPFAAADADALALAVTGVADKTGWPEIRAAAAELRATFDPTAPCRLALVVEQGKTALPALCANALTMLRQQPAAAWSTPDGAWYAVGAMPGQLGLLFPGQGAQYTGMLRDLACAFPQMLTTLETADQGFAAADGARLSDLIYPPTAFSDAARDAQEAALRATDAAQPAIGAVSLGALRVLESFGLAADAAAGHSYGELTALCAAQRLDETSFHALSRLRGQLMAAGDGDKGSMLAVSAALTEVQQLLDEERLELVIANRNAPAQAVLSGGSAEIDRAAAACAVRKLACKRLPVAAAFHSPLVADAAAPLGEALAGVALTAGTLPVYANSTAAGYPADTDEARRLLAGQLARPVEFVAEIEAMYASGVRTFVEIGPGARLSGLVDAILAERPHAAVALDASGGRRCGLNDLARCLAQLAVLGYNLALTRWDEGFCPAPPATGKKPALTINLNGANYVKPKEKRPPLPPRPAVAATPAAPLAATGGTVSSPSASAEVLAESLRVTREGMAALMRMQEETAQLHRRFLEGQDAAGRTVQLLLEQQQRTLQGGAASFVAPAPATFSPGVPVPAAPAVAPSLPVAGVAPQVVPALQPQTDRVAETLLAVISEKTGYPVEMLELEMGMDADLGIDSIKRVEILSALQERLPGAPAIGPEHLGTLQTLGEIARFLGAGSAPAAPPAGVAGGFEHAAETLLAVISEKTGYPVEMLELEMGMDADLGIDSIKRVEILSALQERLPGAPVIGPEHLGTLQTLGEIARFLGAGSAPAAPLAGVAGGFEHAAATLLAVISEKTGYPVEMLELEMGMDADLGIDSIKRVEILSALQERLPGAPVIGPEHLGTLQTLGEIARFLGGGSTPAPGTAQAATAPAEPLRDLPSVPAESGSAPIRRSAIVPVALTAPAQVLPLTNQGPVWITNDGSTFSSELCARVGASGRAVCLVDVEDAFMEVPAELAGLVICAPAKGTDDSFFDKAFLLLKRAAAALQRAGENGGALLATISRLDGAFGCGNGTTLADPLSGGLAGMTKTAAHEWQNVACKAIDTGRFENAAAEVEAVAGELFLTGPPEIGLTPGQRLALEMAELPEPVVDSSLQAGEVVIITGGGRGVTAATAIALAERYQPLLVLLGRSPEPCQEPDWLVPLREESQIKRAILEHAGKKPHPREIEERYQAIAAGRELRDTQARIAEAGGRAVYRSVDIRDAEAVAVLCAEIRREFGPIRGIVHGAGVLADRLISDKTLEEFTQVYGTKVTGLRALLAASAADDLRFIALFSSTSGRFGRRGQIDYAVANEVLNKLAQAEARRRPGCRTVSINWGPWDGGMVTPALKKVFAGEGLGLIGLREGGELLAREIAATGAPVEITVLADSPAATTTSAKPLAEAFSLTLSMDEHPFLKAHVIDGKAVLPMAMIVEWLAHGALHGNPGFRFHGFNELRICKGVILDPGKPCQISIMAGKAEKWNGGYLVPVELTGGKGNLLHARADILLTTALPQALPPTFDATQLPAGVYPGPVYAPERLFHGELLRGIETVDGCSAAGIVAMVKAAPKPERWIRQPLRNSWIADPLVIDSAFQLMILWSFERSGAGSLPTFAGRYRQFREAFPAGGVRVLARVTAERPHSACADIDFLDKSSGELIARLEQYECIIDESLQQAFQRNRLASAECVALEAV